VKQVGRVALGLVLPAVIAVVWWFSSNGSTSVYFPPLRTDLESFRETWFFEHFKPDLIPSLIRFGAGFLIATVVGVTVGTLLGHSPRLRRALWPLTEFARSMPVAALVPIGLVVLGPGTPMEITIVAFACTWPIVLNSIDGIRSVDPLQVEMARVYGLSNRDIVRRILMPSALPQIFTGLRIALAIALAAMVIANMFGSSEGIGHFLVYASASFNLPQMWAGLLMIGLLGALVNLLFAALEHRTLAWHRGWRGVTRLTR
jgi:ABC-type nitrate/sulfonate/bicarbonate transport system permease component